MSTTTTTSSSTNNMDPFARLDADNVVQITHLLFPLDVIVLQRVSKAWRSFLASEQTARAALVHYFPYSTEAVALRRALGGGVVGEDAVVGFRRCVYRAHTRSMGCPTKISHVILEPHLGCVVEWGTAGDFVCWVTRAMTTLHVQNIHGGVETRRCVKFMEVVERNGLPISNEDVSNAMLRIQVGEEVLTVTLNCYDDVDDDDGSGRRAYVLVFALEDLRYMWYHAIQTPYKMLGEPDTAGEHLIYVRKKIDPELPTFFEADGEADQEEDDAEEQKNPPVQLMIHNLRTGKQTGEILLERGDEISTGDVFFIVVSDSSFKRLVVLFERGSQHDFENVRVYARIYSLHDKDNPPGKLLAEYLLAGNHGAILPHGRQHRVRASSNVCVDYPTRIEKFDIVESLFITAAIPKEERERTSAPPDTEDAMPDDAEADLLRLGRQMTGQLGLYSPIHLSPPTIAYNTWDISATRSGKLNLVPHRFLAQVSLARDFHTDSPLYSGRRHNVPVGRESEACSRFEVLMPLQECSAIFSYLGNSRYNFDLAVYEEVDSTDYEYHKHHSEPHSPALETQLTQPARVMRQSTRRVLSSRRLTVDPGTRVSGNSPIPYEISAEGEIALKGVVNSHFLPNVQWSEKCITVKTNWLRPVYCAETEEGARVPQWDLGKRGDVTGIVVFDFSPAW